MLNLHTKRTLFLQVKDIYSSKSASSKLLGCATFLCTLTNKTENQKRLSSSLVRKTSLVDCALRLGGTTAFVGGGIFYYNTSCRSLAKSSESPKDNIVITTPRSISSVELDNIIKNKEITLYQYEACPFCSKVRSFMDYNDIPYHIIEVNPMKKKALEKISPEYKKVPVIQIGDQILHDSTEIINFFCQSKGIELTQDDSQWRRWIAKDMLYLLSPNMYRTFSESIQAFDYITEISNFSTIEKLQVKYGGALIMYLVAKKNKNAHNLTDVRESLYKVIDVWVKDAVGAKQFVGGSSPSIADIEMFGIIRAVRPLEATWNDLASNTGISEWFSRMEKAVGETSRLDVQRFV